MAGPSVANIGVGAPLATGGISIFAPGAALPTDVTPLLPAGATRLGYVADDGLRPSGQRTSTDIFDWAGDLIYSPQDNHSTAFQFKLYSAYDPDVLAEAFGSENVSTVGDLTIVEETGSPLGVHPWMFDMRDGNKRVRIVAPEAQVTAITEGPFVRNGLQSFDCTLTCYKDVNGRKAYRYYNKNAAAGSGLPTITSHAPVGDLDTAGGELLVLTGTNFTGTTGVTVGAAAVGDFQIVDNRTLSIITPANSAGAYDIVVTNAAGASAGYSVSYA
ncbi:IPT/TIG domain-containing protein [Nocardia otitidiscaviarum]|uniref:IPT/TIG domain-containing protein n=1 Tax=Nocardia otitidiscaviarum TaxID=1823 RepID=UPI001895B90B|nr:IPT/TIG domain-containing protein [Nocardia otitidiscaviarum]MBF6133511.1 IPT/TIG domain-containing protein [Nocardia otitidiscaviarum]